MAADEGGAGGGSPSGGNREPWLRTGNGGGPAFVWARDASVVRQRRRGVYACFVQKRDQIKDLELKRRFGLKTYFSSNDLQ